MLGFSSRPLKSTCVVLVWSRPFDRADAEAQLADVTHLSALPNLSELVLQVLPHWLVTEEEFEASMAVLREAAKIALQKQSHGRLKTAVIRVLSIPIKEERLVIRD